MRNKSDENWRVGQRCLNDGDLNAATSRFYYAVFQAVLAWAKAKQGYLYKGFGAHRDMARLVRSQGKAREHYGNVFEDLMGLRITADYEQETPGKSELSALLADSEAIKRHYFDKMEN